VLEGNQCNLLHSSRLQGQGSSEKEFAFKSSITGTGHCCAMNVFSSAGREPEGMGDSWLMN
jgi:hypothetical protein